MDNFDLKKYLIENKVTTNSRMMKEGNGDFFAQFKKAYSTFLEDEASPEETEVFNFVDKSRNVDKHMEYPSTNKVVNMTVQALQAANIDSVEKLYSANNKEYNGESTEDFFNTLEVEPSYTGVGFSIIPGVDLFFDEEGGEVDESKKSRHSKMMKEQFKPTSSKGFNNFAKKVADIMWSAGLEDPFAAEFTDWEALFDLWNEQGDLSNYTQSDIEQMARKAGVSQEDMDYILDLPQVLDLERG